MTKKEEMIKQIYIVKWECDWVVKDMCWIKLTKEEFTKYNDIDWIVEEWNGLLSENFPTWFWIEEYDWDYWEKTEEQIE